MSKEILVEQILSGNSVLFLGAGAVATSVLENGETSPLGNGLAKKVYEHFYKEEYSNEPLTQVSSMIGVTFGADKLHDYLFDFFKNIKPSIGLTKLPTFSWKNIYTTNIDQAIEESYKIAENKAQDITTVIGPLDVSSADKQTRVTLYKLHGCISRRDIPLVFSLEEYATSKDSHLKLFNSLTNDLIDSPVIFIGYSMLDSNFQETWSTIKKYCKLSSVPNKYYYVAPFLKKPHIEYLEKEGFVVFNENLDDFFNNLTVLTKGKRNSLQQYYLEHSKPLDFFEKTNLSAELRYTISKNFDFPQIEVSYPHPKSNSFYKGNEPSWAVIKHNLDAKRDLLPDLIESFESWIQNPNVDLWIITGRAGDGKSTLLRRLAYELSLRIGETVFYSRTKTDLNPELFIEINNKLDKPFVLFIDNTTDRIGKINRLITFFKKNKIKALFIGAARTSDWNIFDKDFFIKPVDFRLNKLSNGEINNILDVLKFNNALAYLEKLEEDDRFAFFKEKAERELIVAMKEATYNLEFDEIIANEYAEIKSEDAQKAYLHICLINQFRYRIPQSLLLRVLHFGTDNIYDKIFKYTEEIIYVDDSPDGSDFLLRARHSIIAGTIVKYYFADDVKKFDFLKALLEEHIPSNPLENSLVKKLYHHTTIKDLFTDVSTGLKLYELLAHHIPGNYFILQQKAIFLSNYLKDYDASKTAIKQALGVSDSFLLQNTEGTIYLNEALDEEDYDKSKFLMEKGKRILINITRRNYKNNSYSYHSLINHLISWYQKFDPQDSRILEEIQMIIDEANKKHPNDHLILTECGKLDKFLDKTESAIDYFTKAININPRNFSARTLLARAYLSKSMYGEALKICEDGIRLSYENNRLNITRFEIAHKMGMDAKRLKADYSRVISQNPFDQYLKLMYAAFLYIEKDQACHSIFMQLRNSPSISYEERFIPHPEIADYLGIEIPSEFGIIAKVTSTGYYFTTSRFNTKTQVFLHRRRDTPNFRVGDAMNYRYIFNLSGPIVYDLFI